MIFDPFITVYHMRPAAIKLLQSMSDADLIDRKFTCFRLSLHYFHKEATTLSLLNKEDYFNLMQNICYAEPIYHIN
jgi:hypothetical protein